MENEYQTSDADNYAVMKMLKEDWNLGPEKASEDPMANSSYWQHMAEVWQTTEEQARRMLCANCEYFDNTPDALASTDNVSFNKYDADGGGRGWCHKFDFICHNLRTCQAWEERIYMKVEDE